MLRYAPLALGLACLACSSTGTHPPTETSGTPPTPPSTTTGTNDGGTTSSSCGFVLPSTSFALPSIPGAPVAAFPVVGTNTVTCTAGTSKLDYTLLDMDGDGALDLLVTSTCADATVGTSTWLVYPGGAGGFASTATRLVLPPVSAAGASFQLFDVNGDLRLDYVVTKLSNDATVGSSRWLVYAGSSSGFANTPSSFALPPGTSPGAFTSTSVASATCTGGQNLPAYGVFDVDGDGFLDVVVTTACDDASIGTLSWRVYKGTATGVAPTPITFPLPTAPTYTAGAFASTSGTLSCGASVSKPQFALVDFDADGKLDLLVTQSCNDPSVGSNAWLWFRNTGSGFGTSTAIPLPELQGVPTNAFPTPSALGTCSKGTGTPTYALADANGDGRPDILVTTDCADLQTGAAYWQLFANTGVGFVPGYQAFTLPTGLGTTTTSPAGLAGTGECTVAPTRPSFTTTYLAGLTLDIVATTSCTDATVGGTKWLVYAASCK